MHDLPALPATPPGRYRHHKGGEYQLLGAARHSETLEPLVLYRPLYGEGALWVRPHAMFFESVEVNGRWQPRFAPMDPAPARPAASGMASAMASAAYRNPVRIEPISVARATGFHQCLDTVARERRYLAQVQAPPLEKVTGFVQDSVNQQVAQLVALDGEQVVGWADVFPHWAHALAHTGTLGMGVLPSHRGQGVGKQLLLSVLAAAQARGLTRISLEARADNTRAIALYEAVGFQHEAVKRKALRYDGVYFDAVQMALLLGDAA